MPVKPLVFGGHRFLSHKSDNKSDNFANEINFVSKWKRKRFMQTLKR